MRAISRLPSSVPRSGAGVTAALAAHHHLVTSRRHVAFPGGGRGDIFKRNASQHSQQYGGAARGIVHFSESTEPQDGQLHIRKRREHISYDRRFSGGVTAPPAIATWSYLIPSLRANVEAACPDELVARLQTEAEELSQQERRQLTEAQNLFRFELQQRIGLLEDSLAEAELPYLLQWPTLFQRLWLRLPLHTEESTPTSTATTTTTTTTTASTDVSVPAEAGGHLVPLSTAQWASSSPSSSSFALSPLTKSPPAGAHHPSTSFATRLDRLTTHVVACVEQKLSAAASVEGKSATAPKSRRQAALEASWRAQWQAAMQWHRE